MNDTNGVITVDKGIPVPRSLRGRSKYPFRQMEIGDSCFIPRKNGQQITINHLKPLRFTTRHVVENGIDGVRVWRIE